MFRLKYWRSDSQIIRRVLPIRQDIAYSFCFTGAETEIHKIKDDSKIDREKNIDRRGPRQNGIDWHIPDPPTFWLPTTFKGYSGAWGKLIHEKNLK